MAVEWLLNDKWIFWMMHYWIMSDDWMVILNDTLLNDIWATEWLRHSCVKMLNEEDWLW